MTHSYDVVILLGLKACLSLAGVVLLIVGHCLYRKDAPHNAPVAENEPSQQPQHVEEEESVISFLYHSMTSINFPWDEAPNPPVSTENKKNETTPTTTTTTVPPTNNNTPTTDNQDNNNDDLLSFVCIVSGFLFMTVAHTWLDAHDYLAAQQWTAVRFLQTCVWVATAYTVVGWYFPQQVPTLVLEDASQQQQLTVLLGILYGTIALLGMAESDWHSPLLPLVGAVCLTLTTATDDGTTPTLFWYSAGHVTGWMALWLAMNATQVAQPTARFLPLYLHSGSAVAWIGACALAVIAGLLYTTWQQQASQNGDRKDQSIWECPALTIHSTATLEFVQTSDVKYILGLVWLLWSLSPLIPYTQGWTPWVLAMVVFAEGLVWCLLYEGVMLAQFGGTTTTIPYQKFSLVTLTQAAIVLGWFWWILVTTMTVRDNVAIVLLAAAGVAMVMTGMYGLFLRQKRGPYLFTAGLWTIAYVMSCTPL